jgi:hypothetical protein
MFSLSSIDNWDVEYLLLRLTLPTLKLMFGITSFLAHVEAEHHDDQNSALQCLQITNNQYLIVDSNISI